MLVLAARNLFRNTRRTVITLLGIAFGLMMVEVAITLQAGQYAELVEKGVSSLAGHVVVQADGWQDGKDELKVLTGASAVTDELRAAFPGATVTPRLLVGGLLTSPRGSVGVGLSGIDAVAEATVQEIDGQVKQGTWLDGDGRGIVIGEKLAESLQVKLGEKVVYLGQHGTATEVQSRLFRVKGIFRTGAAEFDGFLAFADLPAVQEVYGTPDVAHQVALHLGDPEQTDAALATISASLAGRPEVDVLPWPLAIPDVVGMIAVDRKSNNVIMFVIGSIVTMGALNTVLMSAMERTREFGVMMALGLRPRQLARLILTEGVLLGLLGAAMGLALGLGLSYPLVEYGLDYRDTLGESYESGGIVASGLLKGRYNLPRGVGYAGIAVVMTTLSALYPAWFVSRLQPVAAMRHT
jgi:ABC-type lipoprotein release transport system permease subunit